MQGQVAVSNQLAKNVIDRVESLLLKAEAATKPLELDPYRSQLFEMFVMAEAAGFLVTDSKPDLTADGMVCELSQRWQLAAATHESVQHQSKLSSEQLSKMRLLWSFLRMWMEWTYAWQHWPEFHQSEKQS